MSIAKMSTLEKKIIVFYLLAFTYLAIHLAIYLI